ncbi:FHA domain-containing protein [Plantactinospora sp. CA-290183]|uniref:FHA domain-containing protein n=1 Tax=Plantactinospora sp. CA-290183 TaxID=3240006 RepID=UPI003D8E7A7A
MSDELDLLPLLTVASGALRGASFRLRPGLRRIGREDGADVLLDDPKVSRRHATVERVGGRVLLADTGSTNGTWLNDRRLDGRTELRDGDRIRVGHVELRFFDPGTAATDPVGTFRYALAAAAAPPLAGTPPPAGAAASPSGALHGPTQLMGTPRRSRRMLVLIGGAAVLAGCLVLASWATWSHLALR